MNKPKEMASPAENEDPMEEIEEGEIADASNEGFDDSNGENLPALQRKASLNDLVASRYWNDVGRREESPRFVDQGQSGTQWRREGLQYSTSNGNYNPNLYNLAWAKAVQSKPAFSSENSNNNAKTKDEHLKNSRGRVSKSRDLGSENTNASRNGRNFPARRNDDFISISSSPSASGSSSSDATGRAVRAMSGKSSEIGENETKEVLLKVGTGGFSDNDEKMEASGGVDDEREEGELEEGEIEVGSGFFESLPSSPEGSYNSGNALVERRVDHTTKYDCPPRENPLPVKNKHQIGLKKGLNEKQGLKDHEKAKGVADIAEMLKSVTVKDAQKAFTVVCDHLHKAVECLIEMSHEGHYNDISGIVKQIFSGVQAAYAVYKTGSPKHQEPEKSAFPRLLEFVTTVAQKHFTNNQMKELEAMLLSVLSSNRILKADTAQEKQHVIALQSSMENGFKPEGRERSSPSIDMITETFYSKPIGCLNNANEITNNSRTCEPNKHTTALTFTETDRASSNNSFSVGGVEPSAVSDKVWLDPEEPNDSNLPTPTREGSPACWNQQNLRNGFVDSQTYLKPSIPYGKGTQDETDESAFWSSEPVNAVTYYQEKFGRKTFYSNNRLPSPTPSEDNEEDEASYQGVEVSSSAGNMLPQQSTEEREMRDTDIDGNLSVLTAKNFCPLLNSDIGSQGAEPGIQSCSSLKLELPVSWSKDSTGAVETRKTIDLMAEPSRKALPKSRDPRLRAIESEFDAVDLNRQACQVGPNLITKEQVEGTLTSRKHKTDDDLMHDLQYSKRQRNHLAHHMFCNNFPVMMSGSGGWLEESPVIPSSSEWDQTLEIEVDGTGVLPRHSALRNESNSISGADREHMVTDNGNLYKRQKTESFYQSNTSLSPAIVASQLQSSSIDGNINFKTDSAGEEVKGKRKQSDMTDIGHQTQTSVNLTSNIMPSVLKDIAVNPTMLLSLLKPGQENLPIQAMQKIEQYQHTNPPSGPTGASMPILANEMEVNPSVSKPSNLQQQLSQSLAAAAKPAIEIASMGGESRKRQMKPRDPRRVLPINSGCEDLNLNGTAKSSPPVSREIHTSSSRSAVADLAPKLNQVPRLPNIEQNFKEKLVSIAEILGKSDMKTLQALSSQLCVDQPKRPTERIDMDTTSGRSSNFHEMDIKQDVAVLGMVSIASQSLPDENIAVDQNKPNPWGDLDHLLEGYSEEQRLAIHQERARRIEEQNKMFRAKKLCLVLDLDHTLLNSAKFVEVDLLHDEILRKKEEQDKERPQRHLFRFPHMGMWTKLRPGIWNFLERASKLYELHVYTMGNKVYATEMAKILDPTGTLFAGRVISKGDEADVDGDDRLPKSKDLDGVLGMESAVVIIDDSARVWPHHRHNLILVERYMYFPCSRRQFGLSGPSLLELDVDERAEDGTLASSLAVIEKIHHTFFSSKMLHEVDVRDFLAAEQRNILIGCKVVFSRVFPVGEAQPHLHPLWQMAEQFGAVCTTQIDEQVTHVVAIDLGTNKVNWALQRGRYVVNPHWLEASALLYRRANERDYPVPLPLPLH